MEIEENENNLTVMVVDGRLKYYQKKDADKLLNQQQKEIEQLIEEMFLKDVAHKTTQNLWSKTLEENTKLKEVMQIILKDGYATESSINFNVMTGRHYFNLIKKR